MGVVVGYAVFAGTANLLFSLSGRDPHAAAPIFFMLLATLYGLIFAALGGYLAALIGGSREPAIALAVIIGAGALVSLILASGAHWSQLAALIFMAPAAFFGGKLIKAPDPMLPGKSKISGIHLVNLSSPGYCGTVVNLDIGTVDLGSYCEYGGYDAPQPDVVSLNWEGSGNQFTVLGKTQKIKRLIWQFEGVSAFDVGPRDPAQPESEDRRLDQYEVVETEPIITVRFKFQGGVVLRVSARTTSVVIYT